MSEKYKKINEASSDLFKTTSNSELYSSEQANSVLTFETLKEAYDKAMEMPTSTDFTRYVSAKAYDVITEMRKENKLDEMGFPCNIQEAHEYFDRLSKK